MNEGDENSANLNTGGNSSPLGTPAPGVDIKPGASVGPSVPHTPEAPSMMGPVPAGGIVAQDSLRAPVNPPAEQPSASLQPQGSLQPQPSPQPQPQPSPQPTVSQSGYIPMQPAPGDPNAREGEVPGGGVGQSVQSAESTPPSPVASKKSRGKKPFLVIVLILLLAIGGAAGAYFGYIVPNQPENVWKKAMSNTSKGYDKLIEINKDNKDKETFAIDGELKLTEGESQDGAFNFDFSGRFNKSNVSTKLGVESNGQEIELEVASILAEGETYPDAYLKVNGLDKFINSSPGAPDSFNDQWYKIDKSFFEEAVEDQVDINNEGSWSANLDALAEIFGNSAKKYVFTSDTSMSIFDASEFVGKEDVDGRSQYHYKVLANIDNYKKFIEDFADNLENSEVYKDLFGDDAKPINLDEMKKSIDELNPDEKMDVWVDARTKLIRRIKISGDTDDQPVVEMGLNYDGGNLLPFYIKYIPSGNSDESSVFDLNVSLNSDNGDVDIKLLSEDESGSGTSVELSAKLVRSNDEVKVDIPADVKPISELMESLGLDGFFSSGTLSYEIDGRDKASMEVKLEQYRDDNGHYPNSLTEISEGMDVSQYLYRLDEQAQNYTLQFADEIISGEDLTVEVVELLPVGAGSLDGGVSEPVLGVSDSSAQYSLFSSIKDVISRLMSGTQSN